MPKYRTLAMLAREAEEADRRLAVNPLAAVEVAPDTAELMGAFEETAVGLEDFTHAEPGAIDWFFDSPEEAPASPGRPGAGRGGRQ
jgi:hypothetical protein